jgi:hypothetical protein
MSSVAILAVLCQRPIPQDPSYHQFADRRTLFGIANFGDVASNALFCLVGGWGVLRWARVRRSSRDLPFLLVFVSLVLVGGGSAYYHLAPDNARLVWDRLPITVVFTSLFAWVIADRVSERIGLWLLLPCVTFGLVSVWYWQHTESLGLGDLRPYVVAQFYPPLGIMLLLVLFSRGVRAPWTWVGGLGAYALAKVLEAYDTAIFAATGWASGHTLKHGAAALSAYCLYRIWQASERSATNQG